MTANNQEKDAIILFLEQIRDERAVRRRLFTRAAEEPEKVLVYLDSLPEGVESQDELYQNLRSIATAALEGRIDLID